MVDPQSEARTAQARQLLQTYLVRLSRGIQRVAVALAIFWSLSQLVWLVRIVTGVGVDHAWHGGAFGSALWNIVKFTVVAIVVIVGALPAVRWSYADLLRRGIAVPAKIARGPDFVLARLFGGALDILLLDTLLGHAVPARLVNFEVDIDSHRYGDLTGAMYPDEVAEGYENDDDPPFALVDPENPSRRAWLIRRRVGQR
jgi:hypothetical protein